MNRLPAPEFVRNDPAAIEADLIAQYEAAAGKKLYPAQIELLLIHLIAYAQSQILAAIQHTGEQMLVRTSTAPVLDYLGDLVGTRRLLAQPARATFAFTLPAPAATPTLIPFGTRIVSQDGRVSFTTDADLFIAAGQTSAQVNATCEVSGTVGNDWPAGSLTVLDAPLPFDATVRNTSIPSGGADEEDDERYRLRIISAPEAYTNAGSYGAYRHHAMSAHQSIVDVAVYGPTEGEPPGQVALYPLTETGLPSDTLLAQVAAAVSNERVRPLTDWVVVRSPQAVDYDITAALTFYTSAERVDAMQRARAALDAWLAERQRLLGVDLVPEQISAVLHVPGVYRVQVTSPALQVLERHQWGRCIGVTLTDGGVANG